MVHLTSSSGGLISGNVDFGRREGGEDIMIHVVRGHYPTPVNTTSADAALNFDETPLKFGCNRTEVRMQLH
jgi:hypothetical protein